MSKLKNNKGITLVALIITIIVLLILATVSIRLVMNGGIIDKSKNAVDKYSNEEIMEQIKLAYQEYQMSQYTDNPLTLQQAMDKAFGEGVATVSGDATNGYKVKVKGIVYPLSANGTVEEGLPEGKVKFGNQILGVGDQVNYDPTLNAAEGTTTYTSLAATSGYESNQSFDAATYKKAGFKWRVLDVKNGKIRLIADTDVGPGDYRENATRYYLKGSAGYINGVAELNAICSIFGKGKGAESATSITVDDVNGITGYNPASAKYNEGQWGEYGSKVTYTRGTGNQLRSESTNGKDWPEGSSTANPKTFGNQTFTNYFADGSKTLSTLAENSSTPQITSTYYYKSYNESDELSKSGVLKENGRFCEPYELIFGNYEYNVSNNYDRSFKGTREHSYWLASEYVDANYSNAYWGLRFVNGTDVFNGDLYGSYGSGFSNACGVRPVVSLKSDVNIKWNATANEWQIQ